MTHDIFSVKLYELDKTIGQLHSRIEQGEMDSPEQIAGEIREIRRECREDREILHNKMKYSKAKLVGRISEAYERVDQVLQEVQEQTGEEGRALSRKQDTYGRISARFCNACGKSCVAGIAGGNPGAERTANRIILVMA